MLISHLERELCRELRDLPKFFNNRYGPDARQALQRILFRALVNGNDNYLGVLFNQNLPTKEKQWILRDAQGAVNGSEYTEAARGKPCGHIFKSGEATYRCRTCTSDDTCVLCSRCFESSDHTGHMVYISISPGNSGCCDCGDAEAWRLPVNCAIHTAGLANLKGKEREPPLVPDELAESIRTTVGRAFDYMCDVISCSPDRLRLPKSEETIQEDERVSRLASKWYEEGDDIETEPEFALILWNDEKHTVTEVQTQVARACRKELAFGLAQARETDDIGRSVVTYSRDAKELLRIANIIENIKITVTIRSARDTFREQMCSTIIEWLLDISGCTVGQDNNILKHSVCREMLKLWRTGSEATNATVGKDGIDDHQLEEVEEERESMERRVLRAMQAGTGGIRRANLPMLATIDAFETPVDTPEDNDNEEGDDEDDGQMLDGDSEDQMELDLDLLTSDADGDLDMPTAGEPEDTLEVSEATYAGYPPPPPPPQPQPSVFRAPYRTASGSDSGDTLISGNVTPTPVIPVPKTPVAHARQPYPRPPEYWLRRPRTDLTNPPLAEDILQRVRLDWMILFDLRLWKKARVDLRDLYISTVVTVPEFKRILGLRFAGLYTVLAQLYLVADREPDHSIIYLSLQMLTTPSITEEIVEKGNFLTHLIAILYTFLTTRQVGHPWEVSTDTSTVLAFEAGSVTNRRMYHFFMDLKHLFASEYVQEKLRQDTHYVLQFLDLIKLPQGICPNTRAVGDHIEYETDAWISASLLTREINKLCRQFAEAFRWRRGQDTTSISKTIREISKATIVNSVGAERARFKDAEIKSEMQFKTMTGFPYDRSEVAGFEPHNQNLIVNFVVEKETISFHHALHYTLSWLIDGAKSMTRNQLRTLLQFRLDDLKLGKQYRQTNQELSPETYLVAMFDYPLRVCAWLAQMKAGMWVRNGLSLRHQMSTYRGVSQRDLAHHRDIFLLQTALVTCNPSRILLSMIDRFGMGDWMTGKYINHRGYEDTQHLDVAEDFVHLLIVLLSDRISLIPLEDEPQPQVLAIRRDIAHILCFKPLSFSDLCGRLAEKFQDLEEFQTILEDMTVYKAPEGLSDCGTFELKSDFIAEIDPYIAHYTKNQRDEAETLYRTWMSKKIGKPAADIVFEPKLRSIRSGVFEDISMFSRTPLFAQIIYFALRYASTANDHSPEIPLTRVETYLQVVLHLVLSAILEDNTNEDEKAVMPVHSFVDNILKENAPQGTSPFALLQELVTMEGFKASHARIRLILLRTQQKRPYTYSRITLAQGLPVESLGSDSPMRIPVEDAEVKKQQALARQARVMAQFQMQQQEFLNTQSNIDWGEDDFDDAASVATGYTDEHKQVWKYPSGNCILCQEETNDSRLFGTFALLIQSNILRQTDLEDDDYIREVVCTPSSLDRSAEERRPFGVGGRNHTRIRKLATDGNEVITERQGLGRGFPASCCLQGPVSTGCGHIMHYSCFELYCNATQRRQNHQIARNHPERVENQEFVCPLCKALGNTFLPIVWRGKEEVYPGVLQLETTFEAWLNTNIGLTVSRFHKHPMGDEKKSVNSRHQELFVKNSLKDLITPLALRLQSITLPEQLSPISPQYGNRGRMPGLFPDEDTLSMISPTQSITNESHRMDELIIIYSRLRDTIKKNELSSRFAYPPKLPGHAEELTYTDALSRTVGFSISATEIAQRGVESQSGSLLLDRVSPLVLTHLRILSETTSSYTAIAGLRNAGNNRANSEFFESHSRQLLQLFAGHPQIYGNDEEPWTRTPAPVIPALIQDSFVLLVECAVYLVPALHLEIHHIIRICYVLELVKVALAIYCKPDMPESWPSADLASSKERNSYDTLTAFSGFMHRIKEFGDPNGASADLGTLPPPMLDTLCTAVSTYALPFLRKVVILLHVRYGVEFPSTGFSDIDESEIVRLTKALRMPTLTEIFQSVAASPAGNDLTILQSMISGWINHWSWARKIAPSTHLASMVLAGIRPSHPAIFELIGLPKFYDTLLDEMMMRRCPTTGKDMTDPALCLFCADIFCSQAVCCSKDGLGGCNQHLKKCGHEVGLFINIRKCMILYLHARKGAWTHAPYLDKHGEVDPGLRHGRQLFLNQKRYDALLRNVWLQHGIPTTISRKLEADINNGGWETL